MAEENATGQPQAGDPAQIEPQPQAGDTSTNPQAGEPKTPRSAEEYEREIAALRKEAASHRTKLKKFEDDERARADAQLTEQQKKDKQFADLQKEHADYVLHAQERMIASELRVQAARLGFADPADAIAMLDRTKLVLDDDGNPTNAEDLLKALLKAKPYLAGQTQQQRPQTGGGATSPVRSQTQSGSGEVTAEYVADVMNGKIPWRDLSQAQRTAILNWQASHPYRF